MGDHQKDLGWRPPVIFALVAVAAVIVYALWPNWQNYCPATEKLAECSRQWIGALSGWIAAAAAGITLLYLRRQNDIAGTAVQVANDTLEETRKSNERQLRAYLNIENPYIEKGDDGIYRCWYTIRNTGQTPAHDLWFGQNIVIAHEDSIDDKRVDPDTSFGFIAPGLTADMRRPLSFAAQEIPTVAAMLAQRQMKLWMNGTITYVDVFGHPRELRYRYFTAVLNEEKTPLQRNPFRGNSTT